MSNEAIAFLDVDTQVDFVEPGGKLYAKGAEAIKENLAKLITYAREHGVPLVSSVDAHADGDDEFNEFPPHCLKGTPGQERVVEGRTGAEVFVESGQEGTLPDPRSEHVVIEKQQFSVFSNPIAEKIFALTGAKTFVVFGVVTEVCVRQAALGLLERGYQVRLVEDAIWPIDPKGGEAAIDEMRSKGAICVTTREVIAT